MKRAAKRHLLQQQGSPPPLREIDTTDQGPVRIGERDPQRGTYNVHRANGSVAAIGDRVFSASFPEGKHPVRPTPLPNGKLALDQKSHVAIKRKQQIEEPEGRLLKLLYRRLEDGVFRYYIGGDSPNLRPIDIPIAARISSLGPGLDDFAVSGWPGYFSDFRGAAQLYRGKLLVEYPQPDCEFIWNSYRNYGRWHFNRYELGFRPQIYLSGAKMIVASLGLASGSTSVEISVSDSSLNGLCRYHVGNYPHYTVVDVPCHLAVYEKAELRNEFGESKVTSFIAAGRMSLYSITSISGSSGYALHTYTHSEHNPFVDDLTTPHTMVLPLMEDVITGEQITLRTTWQTNSVGYEFEMRQIYWGDTLLAEYGTRPPNPLDIVGSWETIESLFGGVLGYPANLTDSGQLVNGSLYRIFELDYNKKSAKIRRYTRDNPYNPAEEFIYRHGRKLPNLTEMYEQKLALLDAAYYPG